MVAFRASACPGSRYSGADRAGHRMLLVVLGTAGLVGVVVQRGGLGPRTALAGTLAAWAALGHPPQAPMSSQPLGYAAQATPLAAASDPEPTDVHTASCTGGVSNNWEGRASGWSSCLVLYQRHRSDHCLAGISCSHGFLILPPPPPQVFSDRHLIMGVIRMFLMANHRQHLFVCLFAVFLYFW